MWAVTNYTPYVADGVWTRNKDGIHEWIVAVKATFEITSRGETRLARDQASLLLLPEHIGTAGASSLRYDADLIPTKPTTDVLLNGTGYAPGGRPTPSFLV